jgi:hypothetical protein
VSFSFLSVFLSFVFQLLPFPSISCHFPSFPFMSFYFRIFLFHFLPFPFISFHFFQAKQMSSMEAQLHVT